jgi:hypothetical protein
MAGMGMDASRIARAVLGRFQGPEFFASTPHTGVVTQTLIPKNLSMNRPLAFLWLRWRGRVVIAGANYTAVAAEAPQSIINRIQVQGTFKGTSLTPVSISGATAYALTRLFGVRGSSSYITTGGVTTRQAELSVPLQQLGANFGNTGTYDLDIWYCIPTFPIVSGSSRAQNIVPYLWQPADWADSLQVTLQLGDLTSFGTPAAMTTATFTAFGSGAGSPTVEIYTEYSILGPLRAGFRTAAVVRNENSITSGVTALATNVRLMPLQKQKTTNVIIKSGVNLTGVTSGVNVFATLNDVTLDRTQILVDNKPIRNNLSNLAAKESIGYKFTTIEPQGYLPFSFIDSQSARTAFRADLPSVVGSGSDFGLYTDLIAANANTVINVIQEMIFADADDPYWAGTR